MTRSSGRRNPFAILAAVIRALRAGWTVGGIVGTLHGAPRDANGNAVPFCSHGCGRPAVARIMADADDDYGFLVCAECVHKAAP